MRILTQRAYWLVCLMLTYVVLSPAFAETQVPIKRHVAVVEFAVVGDLGIVDAGKAIAEMLMDPIRRHGAFTLMERTLLRAVVEEQQLCGSSLAEGCIANEVGRLHGVSAIITGSVVKFSDVVTLEVRMIDTTTSEVLNSTTLRVPLHELSHLPDRLENIARVLSGKKPTVSEPLTQKRLVSEIQVLLKRHGFDPGVTDGALGEQTRLAIADYQRSHDAIVDGTASPQVLAHLRKSARHLPKNLAALITDMSQDLLTNIEGRRIYINPIVEVNDRYTSAFSEYFTSRLKLTLVGLGSQVVSDQTAHQSLSDIRGMQVRAKTVRSIRDADAVFSGATLVLDGVYYAGQKGIIVSLQIKDLFGNVLVGTERFISHILVDLTTENPGAKQMAAIADVKAQNAQGEVNIATGKGGVAPEYLLGEHIRFIIQVKKPLYVSIFSVNAEGQVERLFPGPGDNDRLKPRQIYTIPGFSETWHIQVKPPFGTDIVKIFASEARLKQPEFERAVTSLSFTEKTRSVARDRIQLQLADKQVIHPFDLVDFFRGQAKKRGILLYEDSVFVKTRDRHQ